MVHTPFYTNKTENTAVSLNKILLAYTEKEKKKLCESLTQTMERFFLFFFLLFFLWYKNLFLIHLSLINTPTHFSNIYIYIPTHKKHIPVGPYIGPLFQLMKEKSQFTWERERERENKPLGQNSPNFLLPVLILWHKSGMHILHSPINNCSKY